MCNMYMYHQSSLSTLIQPSCVAIRYHWERVNCTVVISNKPTHRRAVCCVRAIVSYVSPPHALTHKPHVEVQQHTGLHVTCVQTAAALHIITCTQHSPHLVCWDLLPSPAVAAQSHDDLSHWPYGEQSAGTVIDIRIGSHQY